MADTMDWTSSGLKMSKLVSSRANGGHMTKSDSRVEHDFTEQHIFEGEDGALVFY